MAFAVDLTRAMGSGSPGLSSIPFPFPQYSSPVCHSPSLQKTRGIHLPFTFCYCMGLTGFSWFLCSFTRGTNREEARGHGLMKVFHFEEWKWKKVNPTSLKGKWSLGSLNTSHARSATNLPLIGGNCLSGGQDLRGKTRSTLAPPPTDWSRRLNFFWFCVELWVKAKWLVLKSLKSLPVVRKSSSGIKFFPVAFWGLSLLFCFSIY